MEIEMSQGTPRHLSHRARLGCFFIAFLVLLAFLPNSALAFSAGDRVKATDYLNVRNCPFTTTTCPVTTTMSPGSTGTISSGPYSGSGFTWWYINWDNGYSGYSVQNYLAIVTAPPGPTLSFTGLTPPAVSTSTKPYSATLSASGTNFNNVNQIVFAWSGPTSGSATWNRGDSDWNAKVTVYSDASMTLQPTVVGSSDTWSGTGTWTVTLRDTAGATASRTFTVTYSPTSPPPGPTLSFTASPGSITSGQSSTLNWSSTNTTSCTASGGWTGAKSVSGSQVVSPSATTTYTLSCSGTGGSVTQSATVTTQDSSGFLPEYLLTVISHGYMAPWLNTGTNGWVRTMAKEISTRSQSKGRSTKIYTLQMYGLVNFWGAHLTGDLTDESGTSVKEFDRSIDHHIVKIEWAVFAGECGGSQTAPTAEVARAAAQVLIYDLSQHDYGLKSRGADIVVHLIGHSRGSSVVGALASEFQKANLVLKDLHLTTLDPHPFNPGWDWIPDLVCESDFSLKDNAGNEFNKLFPSNGPDYVNFWDNYYQEEGFAQATGSYSKAWNLKLDSVLNDGFSITEKHSQVHAYYHGTIRLGLVVNDGDGTYINPDWYVGTCSLGEAGYHWAYPGSRPSHGVNNPLCSTGLLIHQPSGDPIRPCYANGNLIASDPSVWYRPAEKDLYLTFPEISGATSYQIYYGGLSGQANYSGTTDLGAYQGGIRTFPGVASGTYFGVLSSFNAAGTTLMLGNCSMEKIVTVP